MSPFNLLAGLPIALLVMAFAGSNRADVVVRMWPFPIESHIPLYIVALGFALLGFILGSLATWWNARKSRQESRRRRKRIRQLEKSLAKIQKEYEDLHAATKSAKESDSRKAA